MKFEEMKFFIGSDKYLIKIITDILERKGYRGYPDNEACFSGSENYLHAWPNGKVCLGTGRDDYEDIVASEPCIDWMRNLEKIITFNGKKYLKADIEKAISLIKPVE